MAIFRMLISIRKRMDKLCRCFFLFGGSSARKRTYNLIAWKFICQYKSQGGLGIMNLKLMNKSLLCKLLWRYKNPEEKGL
jgi:hypothetical protein